MLQRPALSLFFFFNDTATTEIYTLSLHDALPISKRDITVPRETDATSAISLYDMPILFLLMKYRSEEHTSELQSPDHLVCRLLLEKKNNDVGGKQRTSLQAACTAKPTTRPPRPAT